MLSISPLKSASGAAKYYLSEENPKDLPDVSLEKDVGDNYYLKEKDQRRTPFGMASSPSKRDWRAKP
ncbi:protein of unknown function [Vibrio tapetis subsp. tapetis]|uniref:Uncharacterized protein n=1 Tax=Vibrio tapetis subsp. tapetis TaxID=1671868 RepID=A0A2N8ZHK2_9VIBR|nr:protein of unknown function [Vibrio tapetis subsp. tapetis]